MESEEESEDGGGRATASRMGYHVADKVSLFRTAPESKTRSSQQWLQGGELQFLI